MCVRGWVGVGAGVGVGVWCGAVWWCVVLCGGAWWCVVAWCCVCVVCVCVCVCVWRREGEGMERCVPLINELWIDELCMCTAECDDVLSGLWLEMR